MKHSNILFVTENFSLGGLETHILGGITYLKQQGYKTFLATGNSFIEENLPLTQCEKVITGLNFSYNATATEVAETIKILVNFIRDHDIQILHAHPFFSVIPAFFAAQVTKIPFIYTVHGPASLIEDYGQFTDWFIKYVVLENASLVSNVSEETHFLTKHYVPEGRNLIFRNSVDTALFRSSKNEEQRAIVYDKCCIASRVDAAKINSIKALITLAQKTDIKQVDIYGDGPELDILRDWLEQEKTNGHTELCLKGASNQIYDVFREYPLVAGMGRVVVEAAAMNKPVILTGYDGVKGLISNSWITEAAYANFSGRGLRSIDAGTFKKQLEDLKTNTQPYLLSAWVQENASDEKVWTDFTYSLQQTQHFPSALALDIYRCFIEHQSNVPFTSDYDLLQKVKKILRSNRFIGSNAYKFMQDYEQRVLIYTTDVHDKQVDQQLVSLYEKINRVKVQGVQIEKTVEAMLSNAHASIDKSTVTVHTEIQQLAHTFQNRTDGTAEKIESLHKSIERNVKDIQDLVSSSLLQSSDYIHHELHTVKEILEKETAATSEQFTHLKDSIQKGQSDSTNLFNFLQKENNGLSSNVQDLLTIVIENKQMLQDIVSAQNKKLDQLDKEFGTLREQLEKAASENWAKDLQLQKQELELKNSKDKIEELSILLRDYRKAYEEVGILKMISNRFRPKPGIKP